MMDEILGMMNEKIPELSKTNSSVNVPPALRGKLHVKGTEVLMTSLMSSIETVSFCWGVAKIFLPKRPGKWKEP
ncbi:hypothetical protein CEXT_456621 [Caerostris extrusa]|uniref:Uncharacterized protein n=1 Tax=Caerostris extrusa TaxID=172846 RepID=A0AAV4MSC4_CAEEX|nr:hypothetical protein CEXT_456621 [Caerostris extrusa]